MTAALIAPEAATPHQTPHPTPDSATDPTADIAMRRRDEIAFLVFSAWTICGLFLDGWAHRAGKPESFFTPWHGLLYSGFAAGMLWGALEAGRARQRGEVVRQDRYVVLGGLLFSAAGISDMVWHLVFGVEKDLEALLSPTHLLLMVAGLLLTTAPLRGTWTDDSSRPRSFSDLVAQVGALALSAALVSFFLMFANAFAPGDAASSGNVALDAAAVLITNAVLLAPVVWLAARTPLPRGAVGLHLVVVIGLTLGLDAFANWPFILAALAGGAVAEVVRPAATRRDRHGLALLGAATAFATWSAYYAVSAVIFGMDAPVELWTGPVVLATLSGVGLAWLAADRSPTG